MDSVFEAEGRVGILRLSQPRCDLGGLLNKLMFRFVWLTFQCVSRDF